MSKTEPIEVPRNVTSKKPRAVHIEINVDVPYELPNAV